MYRSHVRLFHMSLGEMLVDYKIQSRDHKRAIRVADAVVDPLLRTTVVPISWLEALRSPSVRLPTGYFVEEAVYCAPNYADRRSGTIRRNNKAGLHGHHGGAHASVPEPLHVWGGVTARHATSQLTPNAIRAGPVVMYITGQSVPVVLNPIFVPEQSWGLYKSLTCSGGKHDSSAGGAETLEMDLRLGMDAIEQCSLFAELRPGGLLYSKLPHESMVRAYEPVQDILRRYGMKCGLAESPLVPRPWLRMRHMFIDELQRGPKMTEFVGYNPRSGVPWRFSQHTRHFRQGIWREITRRNDMNDGVHGHSSWQKSPQQSVPEISFLAPFP